jgi:hypothetical protein
MNTNHTEVVSLESLFAQEPTSQPVVKEEVSIEDIFEVKPAPEVTPPIQEPPTPPVEPTPSVQVTEPIVENDTYSNKIKEWVSEGFFEDVDVEIDGELIPITELKNVTKEKFEEIKAAQKEYKEQQLKEKYVSVEGLDERTKKLIDLKKKGGDISQLIEQQVVYESPLSKIDLKNEADQENLVRMKLQSQGVNPKVIEAQIAVMKEDFTLDTEAEQIYNTLQKQFDDYVEAQTQAQLQEIENEKEKQKEFRKGVSGSLKTLGVNENLQKLFLDNATKTDENGLTNNDILYFESKNNPDLHAKLTFFLNNPEEFENFVKQKVEQKTKIDTVRTVLNLTPRATKTAPKKPEEEDNDELNNLFKNKQK